VKRLKIKRREFIWEEKNIKHIAKHNVNPNEAEGVLKDYVSRETYKDRIMLIGRSGKRILTVILGKEAKGYYVVSARDAGKKERRIYKNEKT